MTSALQVVVGAQVVEVGLDVPADVAHVLVQGVIEVGQPHLHLLSATLQFLDVVRLVGVGRAQFVGGLLQSAEHAAHGLHLVLLLRHAVLEDLQLGVELLDGSFRGSQQHLCLPCTEK